MKLASRMNRLGTETAFEVLVRARALEAKGMDVVHLEIGEPDFDTPRNIIDAGIQALNSGYTHYGPSAGLPELREAIAEDISRSRGIKVNANQVVVTPGGKPIMSFVIIALVDEGDEVIYPNPGFPIYESMINFVGGKPVPIPLREENDFRMDVAELRSKVGPKTKLIIINSPHNPTGGILSDDDLRQIAEVAVANDIPVLSDEIYCRIIYEGKHTSIATFPGMAERTIILDGFSKTYAMTGWRLGYGVMPEGLAPHIARLMTNTVSCTASFTQRAGIEGLKGPQDEVERMVAEFRRRRDVIVEGLNSIPGITCRKPHGAFYVFPNVKGVGMSSRAFADYLLNEAGVAGLSGASFGEYGEGYIRLSYANSIENIEKAIDRIGKAVSRLPVKV
ncbi:MAG: pyridoxal phosphate-dependent aminotransferase [Chloroflexi bacterium]|nr:pyridoxal phosphate-dependent aminotransferase [Chloroflexota bacterium]MCL5075991.1 pyridoxal phosphate-dependent aminotransferase [Chloroflexota bacterium]